jgi:hypothetical protein
MDTRLSMKEYLLFVFAWHGRFQSVCRLCSDSSGTIAAQGGAAWCGSSCPGSMVAGVQRGCQACMQCSASVSGPGGVVLTGAEHCIQSRRCPRRPRAALCCSRSRPDWRLSYQGDRIRVRRQRPDRCRRRPSGLRRYHAAFIDGALGRPGEPLRSGVNVLPSRRPNCGHSSRACSPVEASAMMSH